MLIVLLFRGRCSDTNLTCPSLSFLKIWYVNFVSRKIFNRLGFVNPRCLRGGPSPQDILDNTVFQFWNTSSVSYILSEEFIFLLNTRYAYMYMCTLNINSASEGIVSFNILQYSPVAMPATPHLDSVVLNMLEPHKPSPIAPKGGRPCDGSRAPGVLNTLVVFFLFFHFALRFWNQTWCGKRKIGFSY